LIGIAVVLVTLSVYLQHEANTLLVEQQSRSNVDLTQSFSNSLWTEFRPYVKFSENLGPEELKKRSEVHRFSAVMKELMSNLHVVKVKVINMKGNTVFSTDKTQVGTDRSTYPGFLAAKQGEVISAITFRDSFFAIEGEIFNRYIVNSYIPVRNSKSNEIEAVFEVYSDVSNLFSSMEESQTNTILATFVFMSVLYVFLYFIVRHADKVLARQELLRKTQEEKIRFQAYHDPLTGLWNRQGLDDRLQEAINRSSRHGKKGALLFVDLDRFKLVNDSLGHEAGDQLLRVAANRIAKCLRETDMAFRLSGDEFLLILEDLERPEMSAHVATRIIESMKTPIMLMGHEVLINLSIGITTFPSAGKDTKTLLKEADASMYQAKEKGHNQFEYFTRETKLAAMGRLSYENELQKALHNGEYELYYQSKVEPETSQVVSVEALIRWNHPVKGLVPPNDFIPLLEETGLINSVGTWVVDTACKQVKSWHDKGYAPMRVSVNISARQFMSGDLVSVVDNALKASGLEAKYLELELTESMFIGNKDDAIGTMLKLKTLGVALSIDDFGSGYSSLSSLKHFPIDYLKIDRSFVKNLNENHKDMALTSAIAVMAYSLGIGVIAEGVENQEQLDFFRSQGCKEVQGFLFSKPVSASDFEQLQLAPKRKQA